MKLHNFIQEVGVEAFLQALPEPVWSPKQDNIKDMEILASLDRPPYPAQVEQVILPGLTSLKKKRIHLINGEMGTGKTQMSISTAYVALLNMKKKRNKILFLAAGSKHIQNMAKEAKEILGNRVEVKIIDKKFSLQEAIDYKPSKPVFFVMSKDYNKMTGIKTESNFKDGDICPDCNFLLGSDKTVYKNQNFATSLLSEKKRRIANAKKKKTIFFHICPNCDTKLAQETRKKDKILFSPKKILKKAKGLLFDITIVDEVHEYQSKTLQTETFLSVVNKSVSVIAMTGTLSNGYASSVHHIVMALAPKYMRDSGYLSKNQFISDFGTFKRTLTQRISWGGVNSPTVSKTELPIISEKIIGLLAPFTTWVKIEDLNLKMPGYKEEAVLTEQNEDMENVFEEFRVNAVNMVETFKPKEIKRLGGKFGYMQNNPTKDYSFSIEDEEGEFHEVKFNALNSDLIFPKEEALVEKIRKDGDRKALVFSIYNRAAEVDRRLYEVLSREFPEKKIKLLPDMPSDKIYEWIEKNPCDILVASMLKLSTGFNLPQFPSIHIYESGVNLRTMQQASRRSWRAAGGNINTPVLVRFYAYQGVQAQILDLMAKKVKSAARIDGTAVEGDLLAAVLEEDSDVSEALNSIAKEIEKIQTPDFSSQEVKPGALRPPTKLEAKFEEIKTLQIQKKVPEEIPIKKEFKKVKKVAKTTPLIKTKKTTTKSGKTQLAFDF